LAAGTEPSPPALTGRIGSGPSALLCEVVLDPQMNYDIDYLLPMYVAIEKVLAAEYFRMGLIGREDAARIGRALQSAEKAVIGKWRDESMHDVYFALERHVDRALSEFGWSIPAWHADRSRNDLQACAQVMLARTWLIDIAALLRSFGTAAHSLSSRSADLRMPGYTHFQAAQIISPGFYLAALSDQVLHSLRRLLATYDENDYCPLGSGAMAGQQLGWDRDRMARLLGFRGPQPLALTSVASRGWAAELTAELGLLGMSLSRFCTDLVTWAGSPYGFIDLPDALSAVSSAMPQKKNFPVLERIRGKTGHLAALHLDTVLCQRNTPYTNLVEVSKEASSHLLGAVDSCRAALRLFTAVLDGLTFRADRMAQACEHEYFGGFSLANSLTLSEGIPWRTAQVIVGTYVAEVIKAGLEPSAGRLPARRSGAVDHGCVRRGWRPAAAGDRGVDPSGRRAGRADRAER
jgi:argininosuccinate lyase